MEEHPPKLVVESALMEQVWYQIDRYLQKKWPDIFLNDGIKEFKKSIEDKHNEVMHSKNLINARYQEWEKSQERNLELSIRHLQEQITDMETRLVQIQLSDRKWWQFWKPSVVIVRKTEDDDV